MVSSSRSREETRFLALLAKTQDRAANLGSSKKANKNVDKGPLNDAVADSEADADNEWTGEEEYDWRLPKVNIFINTILLIWHGQYIAMGSKSAL